MWITIPLSGASGALIFRLHSTTLPAHSIWWGSCRGFSAILRQTNLCTIRKKIDPGSCNCGKSKFSFVLHHVQYFICCIQLALLQLSIGIFVAFATYKNKTVVNELLIVSSFLDAYVRRIWLLRSWLIQKIISLQVWESLGAICDLIITIYMFRFVSFMTLMFTNCKEIIHLK
jgi:hypothetical protein